MKYWKQNRVNRVVILLNNPKYGAFFSTKLAIQPQEDTLGKAELMGPLIDELHANHIEAFAWFYPFRSKQAWHQKPEWRAPHCRNVSDADEEFLLDAKNPEAQNWYRTLMLETVRTFPKLDGVDIAEPISTQGCIPSDPLRTNNLTWFLQTFEKDLLPLKMKLTLTPTLTASKNGHLWSFEEIQTHFGVDLPALLKNIHWDGFFPQLNYQEWNATYHRPLTFNENWPKKAFEELKHIMKETKASVPTGIHLELGEVNNRLFAKVLKSFSHESLWGFDVYDSRYGIRQKVKLQSGMNL